MQNLYNVANRGDDALVDELAGLGIAYVPFFPLGGFSPLQSEALAEAAAEIGATPHADRARLAAARAPNMLLIPGTSSLAHLRENLAAAEIHIPGPVMAKLNSIAEKAAAPVG